MLCSSQSDFQLSRTNVELQTSKCSRCMTPSPKKKTLLTNKWTQLNSKHCSFLAYISEKGGKINIWGHIWGFWEPVSFFNCSQWGEKTLWQNERSPAPRVFFSRSLSLFCAASSWNTQLFRKAPASSFSFYWKRRWYSLYFCLLQIESCTLPCSVVDRWSCDSGNISNIKLTLHTKHGNKFPFLVTKSSDITYSLTVFLSSDIGR